jgi:hypothetical protein
MTRYISDGQKLTEIIFDPEILEALPLNQTFFCQQNLKLKKQTYF